MPKSEVGRGAVLFQPSLARHLLMRRRPEEAEPAAAVAVLGRRHFVDDHVMRVQKVPAQENATSLAVPPAVLRERPHLLERVLDDDEALPRRDAIHELHGVGSLGARQ